MPTPPALPAHSAPASDPADDRDLMDRIQADDACALEAAVRRHWGPLLAFARRLLDRADGAEDAVQAAFVSLWERRAGWQSHESLRGLLHAIVRNHVANAQRRRSVRVRWLAGAGRARAGFNPTPLDRMEEGELAAAVERAIAALPARRREVFVLARYHGLSYREIGRSLGISTQTVANQVSAAMVDLRAALRAYLPEAAEREADGGSRAAAGAHRPRAG